MTKEKSISEKLHGRCMNCGRINKPNHNIVCRGFKRKKKNSSSLTK